MTFTKERLEEIAEDGFLKHGESKELARMALAGMEAEPTTVVPDELSEDINDDEYPRAWGYRIGWNACRAAMMNGGVDAQSENESE